MIGQYFGQISLSLRDAILANTANYFIFRVSKADANLLSENLQYDFVMKKSPSELKEDFTKLLTKQNPCECLAQIRGRGLNYSVFKAHTIYHSSPPFLEKDEPDDNQIAADSLIDFNFDFHSNISVEQVMKANTTNRKKIFKD